MIPAKEPFLFVAASYLVRIRSERATTLSELGQHLETVPEGSIFFHTFQSLESHHYTVFSNDFAHWAMAACNEARMAERLAAVDLRDFVSLEQLRQSLVAVVREELERNHPAANRLAFEPFYFCEAIEISIPLGIQANNLAELAEGIGRMSLETLHYHVINSRLRLRLQTNDFSYWMDTSLGLPRLAQQVNRIDFYTNTLEGVRQEILKTLTPWMEQ